MRQALPPTPFEGLELGRMLSQSNGIKVYQGVYRGSPVVVRVRLALCPGRVLTTLHVACIGVLA